MTSNDAKTAQLADRLSARLRGEVDFAPRRRAEYSTDASNYRVVPILVAFPQHDDDVAAILHELRRERIPITARGGGTSVAGNAIGTGAVIDFSRHLNRVLALDPKAATATVQAGCIMSTLQAAAAPYGLRFGPDPSTQNRAAFGGMIGNNACGPHAVAYGRTSDNVLELDCIDGNGRRFTAGAGDPTFATVPGLAELVSENLALIRTEFGKFSRQVSGYGLEHLLPEYGRDLAKALVGSEGTCVTVLTAKLKLQPVPPQPTLVVLGYQTMPDAADAVPGLLAIKGPGRPYAIEGLDARLIEIVQQHQGAQNVPPLPNGTGWLMVEVGGETPELALQHAQAVVAASKCIDSQILPAGPETTRMWTIRADGAGLAGRTLGNEQAWPGWEDSAVPPEHLGPYLRELLALLDKYGLDGVPYGHFGDGCIHLRIDFPLEPPTTSLLGHPSVEEHHVANHYPSVEERSVSKPRDGSYHSHHPSAPEKIVSMHYPSVEERSVSKPRDNTDPRPENGTFRAFLEEAGDLAVKYGGSMSGEHGDGRARSELLAKMYSPAAIELMGKFKALFDPENNLNPGVIVNPVPLDADLRRPQAAPLSSRRPSRKDGRAKRFGKLHGIEAKAGYNGFSFEEDHHDLTKAAHRCLGVGKCRAGLGGPANSFMCPSYQATKDEKDVTRGRARVLQEALNGTMVKGLTSKEVRQSLDLCLSCKACSSDCPAVVDIARWKSEVLHRTYKGKVRPVDHYVLGWLPRWLALLSTLRVFVPLINAVMAVPAVKGLVLRVGGMDPQRSLMKFARTPFHVYYKKHAKTLRRGNAIRRLRSGIAASRNLGQDDATRQLNADSTNSNTQRGNAIGRLFGAAPSRRLRSGIAASRNHGIAASRNHGPATPVVTGIIKPPVVLWTDSFSDGIAPNVPIAAVKVLTAAGYEVIVPDEVACCGLTWISTGQLDGARRRMDNLMRILGPYAVNGIPIMGLEPSCTAVLRSDLLDLFPDDPRAKAIAAATHTFAELLTDPATAPRDWQVPDLSDLKAVVQPHCHHHSVMGFAEDEKLLRNGGAQIEVLSGCCGLAGNFGMQKGHYGISVAVAENALLPALRKAGNSTEFLADGFSCRTQALQLTGKEGKALIEIIAERI